MTSMQAVSGAGYPGVPSLDIMGNILPHIGGEEAKVEMETGRLLGTVVDGLRRLGPHDRLRPLLPRPRAGRATPRASASASRATPPPTRCGRSSPPGSPCPSAWACPAPPPSPSASTPPRTAPRCAATWSWTAACRVHVGRIRPCTVLGIKFTLLGHNTERGAAGGSVLNAELAVAQKDSDASGGGTCPAVRMESGTGRPSARPGARRSRTPDPPAPMLQ